MTLQITRFWFTRLTLTLAIVSILAVSTAYAVDGPIEPTKRWSGKIRDAKLRDLAPKTGFIADAESWGKLWKGWRKDEKLSDVDFSEDLIVIGTAPGPNKVMMRPSLSKGGDLRFMVASTRMGGPGFGYAILQVPRDRVKKVNGRSIDSLHGKLVIPAAIATFSDQQLEIKLWEYDPFLADVSATLIDEFQVEKFGHTQGKATTLSFTVGDNFKPVDDRNYYITVFVTSDGRRTHIGEKDGKNGLCKVLGKKNPAAVTIIVRPVR